MERWKPVVGYEGLYEVSDMGRVKSLPRPCARGGIRKSRIGTHGYVDLPLCKDGIKRWLTVHRLVLEAFRGPCPDDMEGCHNDGNRENCSLDDLRWDTRSNNHRDRYVHAALREMRL